MLLQGEYRFPIFGSKSVQGTIFTDIGRVSDEYKLKELFTDMNYNGGAGIRYYFNKDILFDNELREISTSKGEVPSRKGYPGYLYSDLSSIFEMSSTSLT